MRSSFEPGRVHRTIRQVPAERLVQEQEQERMRRLPDYERFAEILLGTEVSARESHGGQGRIKTARFLPARRR